MNDRSALLSNIVIRSNLLSKDYQEELGRVSVFELKNIKSRTGLGIDLNPSCPHRVTPQQMQQHREQLFLGDRSVSLDDDDRKFGWVEAMVQQTFRRIEEFEARPDEETGFELLYITEQLRRAPIETTAKVYCELPNPYSTLRRAPIQATAVVDGSLRIVRVLQRDEFKYTRDAIQTRLRGIFGDEHYRLELPYGD